MKGTIKVLKEGFGFISSEEAKDDTFFHASSLQGCSFDELSVGDTLYFEIGEGNNGKTQATGVTNVAPEGANEEEVVAA